uniref:NADP-dependent malic enzyme n=1 Tax=Steinernema glaseri TaxID=37863 RepID=A0A1I7ZYP1_9BILA
LSREITNRIQKLRKSAKLQATQPATVYCEAADGTALFAVLNKFQETIATTTGTPVVLGGVPAEIAKLIEADYDVKGENLKLALVTPN